MPEFAGTKALEEKITDLHRGLHIAMDALIRQNDKRRAEEILHEMDFHMANLLRQFKVIG